jgi:hypothetical protein
VRIAAFETMQGQFVSRQLQLPSLEPMQVAGLGQYWIGAEGEIARNYEISIDHASTSALRLGARHTERSIDTPFSTGSPASTDAAIEHFYSRESIDNLSLFWAPSSMLAMNLGWQFEDFNNHDAYSPYGFSRLRTKRLPIEANIFIGKALSVRLAGTQIRQSGLFSAPPPAPGFTPQSSRFWTFDAALDIRLPNRRGSVEFAVKNLLDDDSRYQDTDPENPRIFPERFFLTRFTLSF